MIETTHRNYAIWFNEEREIWYCSDLGIENTKLSGVKRRIDEIGKSERKVNITALMASLDARDKPRIKEVTVTVLCEPEAVPRYRGGDGETPQTSQCWIRQGDGSRCKVDINNLMPLDSRSELEKWTLQHREAQAAVRVAEETLKGIARHDADSLMLASKEAGAPIDGPGMK